VVGEQPRRPMGHPQPRRRRIQRRRYHRHFIDRGRPTRPRKVTEIPQATQPVTLTPVPDRRKTHAHPPTDLRVTRTIRGQHQDPGPLRGTRRNRRRTRALQQSFPIPNPQNQRFHSRHTPVSQSPTRKSHQTRDTSDNHGHRHLEDRHPEGSSPSPVGTVPRLVAPSESVTCSAGGALLVQAAGRWVGQRGRSGHVRSQDQPPGARRRLQ